MSMRIVFMGTPDFAVESLKYLIDSGQNIVGVITAPDKPAGRGKKIQMSPVKQFALNAGINNILQPTNLKAPEFIAELKALNADLQIVVAFRMLPDIVWQMPPKGTINLHASLLPQYRGAAPINWAIINGEKETGVTTFFIKKEIDTGNILFSEKVSITNTMDAGELHDKLMLTGGKLILKTIDALAQNNVSAIEQNSLIADRDLKSAPKIFKSDCKINWNKPANEIYNFIRGLSPYPAAWTEIVHKKTIVSLKIFKTEIDCDPHKFAPLQLLTDNKTYIKITLTDGQLLSIKELQMAGKKRMTVEEFLRGFQDMQNYSLKASSLKNSGSIA